MALITTALAIAEVVPNVLKLFGKDDDAVAASKVVNIAKDITGVSSDNAAVEALKANPEFAFKFQKALMEDKWVQERIDLKNVQSAREMHKINHKQADALGRSIIWVNLPIALILFIGNIFALYFLKEYPEILVTIGNLTGFLLNSLLKERQDVINFYFGSSLGSKLKEYSGPQS